MFCRGEAPLRTSSSSSTLVARDAFTHNCPQPQTPPPGGKQQVARTTLAATLRGQSANTSLHSPVLCLFTTHDTTLHPRASDSGRSRRGPTHLPQTLVRALHIRDGLQVFAVACCTLFRTLRRTSSLKWRGTLGNPRCQEPAAVVCST